MRLFTLYAALMMCAAIVQQFQQDLATRQGIIGHGETIAITEQGRVVARLAPPDDATFANPVPRQSMAEWLDVQYQRMQRTFGNRIIADSASVLDKPRADRE